VKVQDRPGRGFARGGSALAALVLGLAHGLVGLAILGCSTSPTVAPTIRLPGTVTVADGVRIPANARISVRLVRGGETIDEVVIIPDGTPPPYMFELLYDREQIGGIASVVAEVVAEGRVILTDLDGLAVPLDGTGRAIASRLVRPRRAVGP
jgi:hypothetical protein